MIPAKEALERLKAGNARFVAGERGHDLLSESRRAELVDGQEPFAVVLGCSDSRVPVEIVFDQGVGDLFVIRVAGNIVAPSQLGSIEFATTRFGTRLVVVMGHSNCGAVQATLEELREPPERQSRNLRSLVDRVRPAVEEVVSSGADESFDTVMKRAVRANVEHAVASLRHGSDVIEELIEAEGLLVLGAQYSLETGVVEFFTRTGATSNRSAS